MRRTLTFFAAAILIGLCLSAASAQTIPSGFSTTASFDDEFSADSTLNTSLWGWRYDGETNGYCTYTDNTTTPGALVFLTDSTSSTATAAITGFSVTSNVVTFHTSSNSFVAGVSVTITGLSTTQGTSFNGSKVVVLSTGLSTTQFEAAITTANTSGTVSDAGYAAPSYMRMYSFYDATTGNQYCTEPTTSGKWSQAYGYWEALLRYNSSVPANDTAFWLQTNTNGHIIGNPQQSGVEYDIFEHYYPGSTTGNGFDNAVHDNGYGAYETNGGVYFTNNALTDGKFHRFGMAWTPSGVTFYLDGSATWTQTAAQFAVSNIAEYIILDEAPTAGSYGLSYGALGAGTNAYLDVAYVRVYPYAAQTQQTTLAATANAYVTDSAASTNYSGATTLETQSASTGSNYQSFLQFDLTSVPGVVKQATLYLTPVSQGQSNIYNYVKYVSSNTWTENGITWNNKPSIGSSLAYGLNYSANILTNFDATASAVTGKPYSLAITGYSPTGSGTDVEYASRENGDANYQPSLVLITTPGVSLSASSLTYSSQVVDTTSTSQAITVTNSGGSTVTFSSIATSGSFNQTNNCAPTLAGNSTCTINVSFTPTALGTATGALTLTDTDIGSPQTVTLSGTGATGPNPYLSSINVSFGNVTVNTTGSTAVTLTNPATATAPASISSITITGTNAAAFGQTNNCPSSLAIGANCSISLTFSPVAVSSYSATLNINDNAANTPQTAALNGSGTAIVPTITWNPSSTSVVNGNPIGSGVLDASASTAGTFVYTATPSGGSPTTVTASTVLSAGNYTLTASFTPSSNLYTTNSSTISFAVSPLAIEILSDPLVANTGVMDTGSANAPVFYAGGNAGVITVAEIYSTTGSIVSASSGIQLTISGGTTGLTNPLVASSAAGTATSENTAFGTTVTITPKYVNGVATFDLSALPLMGTSAYTFTFSDVASSGVSSSVSFTPVSPSNMFVVTELDDANSSACTAYSSGTPASGCTLRGVLQQITTAGAGTYLVTFSNAWISPQTITLGSNLSFSTYAWTGKLDIAGPGPGNLTVLGSTGSSYGILQEGASPGNFTLSGITLKNGKATYGGCLDLTAGSNTVTVVNTVMNGCTSSSSASAMYVTSSGTETVNLFNSTITGTTGSGLYIAGGSGAINIANSAFTAATGGGAGVNITPYGSATSQTPSLTISNSQFSGNTSTTNGAGISVANINASQNVTTNFTLVNDTISGNTCSTASYGCAINFNHGGGGGSAPNYNLTMVNDTISNNSYTSGTAYAAGIYSRYTNTAFLNTVIEGNSVATLTSGDSSDLWNGSGNNAVINSGSVINSTANTSTTVAQIGLSDLGSFGGPTQTMVPVPIASSPLLKATSPIAAGQVTEASITAGGTGISGTPTLTFTNGNCTGSPAATATVTSGVLTGIKLTSTGTGCTGTTTDATGTWFSIGGLSGGATARAYILPVPRTDARGVTYPASGTNTVDVGAVQTSPSLVFSQQPQTNVATSGTFSPAPAVQYYDFGNPVALTNTSYTGSNTAQITMSAASGTLGGTTSVYLSNASPAVATFSTLTAPGSALTGDSLSATTASGTHYSAVTATSSSFNVYGAATQLAFSTQPSPTITAGGSSGSFQVYVEDASGSLVTSSSASVTLTVTCPACSPSYTPFTATVSANGGVATFSGSNLPTPTIAGTYSYALTNSASLSNPSAASETVKASAATHLTLTGFPSSVANEATNTATVTAYDSYNNIATGYTGTVSFTSSDPNFVQPSSYTYVSADAGTHGFSVALYTAGTQSLTATDGSLSVTQNGIAVGSILWVLNNNGSLSKLNAAGSVFSGSGGDCPVSSSGSGGAAMDSNANVWMVSAGANSLVQCSPNGTSSSTFSGGGLNVPVAVQVDGNGQVWVVNGGSGANSLSLFSIAGAAISGSSGITGYIAGQSALHSPKGMAVDSAGALWVTNGNNTVTQVIGAAAPVTVPTVNAVSNNTLGVKP